MNIFFLLIGKASQLTLGENGWGTEGRQRNWWHPFAKGLK